MEKRLPSAFLSILKLKCPRCRTGDLFIEPNTYKLKKIGDMPPQCPVCGQNFKIEIGFWWGSSYVSYALTVALSIVHFILFILIIGLHSFGYLLIFLVVNLFILLLEMPYLMRVSRALWIYTFVPFDKRQYKQISNSG